MMHLLATSLPKSREYNRMMLANNGDLIGIEFQKPNDGKYPTKNEKYAVALPDASRDGKWRVSYFDQNGFSSHESHTTREQAQQALAQEGFTIQAEGTLDRLAATDDWARGTDYADLIMDLNRGAITHAQFIEKQKSMNDSYEAKKAGGLTAPTRADVLRQQAQAEAEAQRKEQGGDKPSERKVTGDTPDLFNPQGSIFDQPAEPEPAQPMTTEQFQQLPESVRIANRDLADLDNEIASLEASKPLNPNSLEKQTDRIRQLTQRKRELLAAGATQEAADLVNATRSAEPDPATQATTILDAANITGKDRLDILKDVKSGALTPGEVQAAFPGVSPPVANESPAEYDVSEPGAPYETDLFGQPVPAPAGRTGSARPASAGVRGNVQPSIGVQDTPAPAGEYFASTLVGSEVSRELGASRITKPEHAAQATTYLYKSAVERLDGIVTDAAGKPLAIVGGFKGALAQASVYPATIMAEAVRIPGAARIWFSHNHPSGNPELSNADRRLGEVLSDVFYGSGIEPMGMLAIGSGRFSHIMGGNEIVSRDIPTSSASVSVPVIERTLAPNGVTGVTVSSPSAAKQYARDFYDRSKKPGLILLNTQNSIIGWVPITDQMTGELRGTGGLNAIYRAISESNAGGAIIVHGGELGFQSLPRQFQRVTPSENIAAALAKIDVRPLDSIEITPMGAKSTAESGLNVASGPVYARSTQGRGVNIDDAKAVVASVREALPTAPTIYIMESVAQAPADLRKFIKAAGAENDVDAAYHNGEIYVFPANIPSIERMQFVLAHHEIRHHGLAAMLGPRKNAVMLKIHESNPKIRALATEQIRKGYAKSRILATEEALADMPVADLVQLNGFDRIVAAVREWLRSAAARLRRAGLGNIADAIDAKEWTDKDVAALIARAEGVSRGGSARYASEGTVFDRDDGALARTGDQTSTPAFKKWFKGSKVVDAQGRPLQVYHGTKADFTEFRRTRGGEFGPAIYLTDNPREASEYGDGKGWGGPSGTQVMPLYASIKNPYTKGVDAFWKEFGTGGSDAEGVAAAQAAGYDGIITTRPDRYYDNDAREFVDRGEMLTHFIAFDPAQVKSAIGNNGDFDPDNADIRFARSVVTGATARQHTPEQLRAMENVGFKVEVPTLKERAQALWKDAGKKMAQGIVDQFAPVKDLDKDAYALMRLSKGASGAFETFLHGGKLKLSDNVYDFDEAAKGGVVDKLLIPLQGEHHDFMRWVAANRAERLAGEGKENLFSPQDIADLKTLANGTTQFDYKIQTGAQAGQVTRDRTLIYADSLRVFNGFNKNVLDMAEQSGLIDPESRKLWEHEFYVPFYRVADDDNGGIRGANIKGGVVRQAAFKQLKGGKNALNADLLDNTLMNWAHLLDAAAKNRAAKATIEAAEKMGVAAPGNQSTLAQMATSINNKHGVVWFMDGGQKRYSLVDDPFIMTALTSLEYAGMRNPVMNAMGAFKHALTVGVTASPFFKIRNLIRDSVTVIGTSNISPNLAGNVAKGWALTDPKSDAYFRLLAGGGTIHFGTMLEGSEAKRVQALVESGVDDATILGDQNKVKMFYRRYIEPGITAYNELGNRGEAINRASLYDQLRKQGMSHADASLQARDLMDFSMQGTFTTIRFLIQTVPFMNARLQGLYKLGRGAAENPARFAAVVGASALMSIALLAAYSDDDDWKKREEWDRQNFWWFKFGGIAFRIPKPFEIGAIATLAERGVELAFDEEMTGTRFRKQVMALLSDNLSMNPVPQLIKPIIDVYSNKDSFSGRPIESMSMERLKSEYRFTDRTSMMARGTSTAMNSVTGLVGAETLSPVQIDHMLRGYFGWLGSFVVGAGDVIARPATNQPTRAAPDYWKVATGGIIADTRDAPSRYVSQMYDQAREVEQAYGTWRALQREGKVAEAGEFAKDNADKLAKYRKISTIKKTESRLNERIRMIERSNMDAETKRETIRALQVQKDRAARALAV